MKTDPDFVEAMLTILLVVGIGWAIAAVLAKKTSDWSKNPTAGIKFVIGLGVALMCLGALAQSVVLAVIGGFVSLIGAVFWIGLAALK